MQQPSIAPRGCPLGLISAELLPSLLRTLALKVVPAASRIGLLAAVATAAIL
jgi:hypothetical protein